jgi:ketosteroid isomerase-like protein
MRSILSIAALAVAVSTPAFAQSSQNDEIAIREVVTAFNDAIVEQDEAAMLELFLSPDAVFATSRGDGTGTRAQISNASGFASMIANDHDGDMREDFFDIEIQIGETTATMMSRFDFVMGDQIGNHGYETWSLLKVGDEWKIASVIWSSNGPRPADD